MRLLLLALLPLQVAAAEPSATQFVEGLYAQYVGKEAKGVALETSADLRRWFAPELAQAIVDDRDRAEKGGDVPALDGDPFVDAQDWEIPAVEVQVQPAGASRATASVKFTNLGEARTMSLELVKLKAGWRISDIVSRGEKLSALFRK